MAEFETLIASLLSSNNNERKQAETYFHSNRMKFPEQAVLSLLQAVKESKTDSVREMCIVLLKRHLPSPLDVNKPESQENQKMWALISADTQQLVKNQLIQCIQNEPVNRVRKHLADLAGTLAFFILSSNPNGWPELVPFIISFTTSENAGIRVVGFDMVSQISFYNDLLSANLNTIAEAIMRGLNDPSSVEVRVKALIALCSALETIDDTYRVKFQQFMPLMLEVLRWALSKREEEEAREAIKQFIELAGFAPDFFRPSISQCVTAMLAIANSQELEETTRQLGVEFLVTLAENKPGLARKQPDFVKNLTGLLLKMMTNVQENPMWNEGEQHDVDDTEHDIGQESIDRLAISLGGKCMSPVIFSIIPEMIQSDKWNVRFGALIAISVAGEGCQKHLLQHLESVIRLLLPMFSDPHPRVRWAACQAAGQLSTDFGPVLQARFHAEILPALAAVMKDVANPRTQSHAAAAIINFCEHCTPDIMNPYSDALLTTLLQLLQIDNKLVQEQAITAVSAIADCIDTGFQKYYDAFMPLLKNIVANARHKDLRLLRGKAIECISFIAVAVGKEKFFPDAHPVLQGMLELQQKLEADDPQTSFMLQAWVRFCKCLANEFLPYLDAVMAPLLHAASQKADIKILDEEEEDQAEQLEEEGWTVYHYGVKSIGIKTCALEEKSTACNMLYCLADELKGGFFKYLQPVTEILVPAASFAFNEGVRTAAALAMPCLLRVAEDYMLKNNQGEAQAKQAMVQIWQAIEKPFIKAIDEEQDVDTLVLQLQCLQECIDVLGKDALQQQQMSVCCDLFLKQMADFNLRREQRGEQAQDADFDNEEGERLEDEMEQEEQILESLGEVVGKMVKHHGGKFLPFCQSVLPKVHELLKGFRDHDIQVALCIYDDIIEYAGPEAGNQIGQLTTTLVTPMVENLMHRNPGVRQAAAYGVGVAAQTTGPAFGPAAMECLKRLAGAITQADSRAEENVHATENSISAFGKICKFQTGLDLNQLLPQFLSFFPVVEDKVESKVTYGILCHFVSAAPQSILGADYSGLPKLFAAFATALGDKETITDEIEATMVTLLQQMRTGIPPQSLEAAIRTLTPEQSSVMQKILS